jgi:DNA mismatch repair protein MutS2
MSEQTLTPLEFPGLLGVLSQYAVSALGRAFLTALGPGTDPASIQAKFTQIRELEALQDREGEAPRTDFPDLAPWLAKAQVRGSLLPPEALNDVLLVLSLARQLRHFLALGGEGSPHLQVLAARLQDLPPLQETIRECISPHNFILDQASPALATVRRELAQTRELVNRQIRQTFFKPQYQEVLQEPIISQRNGRYVIPIKADHKGAIPGIIHDQSQTRATLYLEPLAIVEHNNALNLLGNREKREEEAVLRRLTDLVRAHLDECRENLAALAELDAICAKISFAREYQCREPIWRGAPGVDFRQARHPLLMARRQENPQSPPVVPVDLKLTPESRWLVISGANAGGKTVALKTLGLLTLMVQSGIPIPVAEGSEFYPFDRIFADIGDPQDLQQDLSTFSAHLKRALAMLRDLPALPLILLDELGTATDPTEGGALALALLQAFYRRGAFGAVTTHLPLLKAFAQRQPGFENVAVVFDEETRRPTYRLAYGVAGASNALKIARELGLPAEILGEAEGYLDQEELKAYRLLGELEAARQHLVREREELGRRDSELDRQSRELEALRREVQAERRRLQHEVMARAQTAIKEAESEFKAIVQRLRQGGESWGRLRQEFSRTQAGLLAALKPVAAPAPAGASRFAPGQQVFLPALGLTGEVLESHKDGRLEVQVRNVRLRVSPEEIAPAEGQAAGGNGDQAGPYALPPASLPSLNLVGLRVDEALPLVDRLLDQALLHGQERVDIIHGIGTGRLKQAVREHLKHHTHVKAIHGDLNPGMTVVDLKD